MRFTRSDTCTHCKKSIEWAMNDPDDQETLEIEARDVDGATVVFGRCPHCRLVTELWNVGVSGFIVGEAKQADIEADIEAETKASLN